MTGSTNSNIQGAGRCILLTTEYREDAEEETVKNKKKYLTTEKTEKTEWVVWGIGHGRRRKKRGEKDGSGRV